MTITVYGWPLMMFSPLELWGAYRSRIQATPVMLAAPPGRHVPPPDHRYRLPRNEKLSQIDLCDIRNRNQQILGSKLLIHRPMNTKIPPNVTHDDLGHDRLHPDSFCDPRVKNYKRHHMLPPNQNVLSNGNSNIGHLDVTSNKSIIQDIDSAFENSPRHLSPMPANEETLGNSVLKEQTPLQEIKDDFGNRRIVTDRFKRRILPVRPGLTDERDDHKLSEDLKQVNNEDSTACTDVISRTLHKQREPVELRTYSVVDEVDEPYSAEKTARNDDNTEDVNETHDVIVDQRSPLSISSPSTGSLSSSSMDDDNGEDCHEARNDELLSSSDESWSNGSNDKTNDKHKEDFSFPVDSAVGATNMVTTTQYCTEHLIDNTATCHRSEVSLHSIDETIAVGDGRLNPGFCDSTAHYPQMFSPAMGSITPPTGLSEPTNDFKYDSEFALHDRPISAIPSEINASFENIALDPNTGNIQDIMPDLLPIGLSSSGTPPLNECQSLVDDLQPSEDSTSNDIYYNGSKRSKRSPFCAPKSSNAFKVSINKPLISKVKDSFGITKNEDTLNSHKTSLILEKGPEVHLYKKRFGSEILCASLWGSNLLIGMENGLSLLERNIHCKVYNLICRRRFQQIDVLEGQNILVTISGSKNRLRVYFLSWLRAKMMKTDGIDKKNGWVNVGENLKGAVHFKIVRYDKIKFLVIAMKRSIEIYAWAPRPYHKFMAFKKFESLEHCPLLVDLTVEENSRLKVIYGSIEGFHAIDLDTNMVLDLYIPNQLHATVVPHCIVILPGSEGMGLLLCYNTEGVFVDTHCKLIRDVVLQWGEVPMSVSKVQNNQIIIWGHKAVELRSITTGLLDGVYTHKRDMKRKFLCEKNDKVFFCSSGSSGLQISYMNVNGINW